MKKYPPVVLCPDVHSWPVVLNGEKVMWGTCHKNTSFKEHVLWLNFHGESSWYTPVALFFVIGWIDLHFNDVNILLAIIFISILALSPMGDWKKFIIFWWVFTGPYYFVVLCGIMIATNNGGLGICDIRFLWPNICWRDTVEKSLTLIK